jgi:alkylation response protein AidB-like acyl-CoA dehydrogenase
VPKRYGRLGADSQTYCLAAEQLTQGKAFAAPTSNMHCLTMLMMDPIADNIAMPPAVHEHYAEPPVCQVPRGRGGRRFLRPAPQRAVEHGETDANLGVDGRRFGATTRKMDGNYVVNGRKFFLSLARVTRQLGCRSACNTVARVPLVFSMVPDGRGWLRWRSRRR